MNIVYASSDGFCPHMLVSIVSLLEHNIQEELHFHILSDGISEERKEAVRAIVEERGKDLRFYPLPDLEEELGKRVEGLKTGKYRITSLSRLLLGSVLPREITKALYLDSDTVVLRPIRELYRTSLQEDLAAMAAEPTIYAEAKEGIGLAPEDPYFNAGVLLLNLSAWREEGLEDACFSYFNERGGKVPFIDQDILNHVLKGRVQPLPQRFNFFSNYYYYRYGTLARLSPWYGDLEEKAAFQEAKRHPAIVHFAGDERPWVKGNWNHYGKAYTHYLAKTPFARMEKEGGKTLYMQLYHGMNLMTAFAPALRKRVSDLYYQKSIAPKQDSN